MAADEACYFGREQSLIKHIILEKYLERFAVIVGHGFDGIIYVDGFSGPWNVKSQNLEDASFSIALRQLRNARDTVRTAFKKDLQIKCVFLEKDGEAFARLSGFANEQKDVEVAAINSDFESAIPELLKAISAAGQGFFPFIFIDPTGWKGFGMQTIAPLLRLAPSEVLVNFMTGFILRFAEDSRDGIDASFQELFGDASFRERLHGLEGRAREDALVFEYAKRVAEVGGFSYVPVSLIPHPTQDRTHFHLVYATRSIRGLEVFKGAERNALSKLGMIRADAKRRKRQARTNQQEMFNGDEVPDTGYLHELTRHYGTVARQAVQSLIRARREVSYDEAYAVAMNYPTVDVRALRAWIAEIADLAGLVEGERVAKIGAGHRIVLRDCRDATGELPFSS